MSRSTRALNVSENVEAINLTPRRFSLDCGYNQNTILSNFNIDKTQNSYKSTSIQNPVIEKNKNPFSISIEKFPNSFIISEGLSQFAADKNSNRNTGEESEWCALGQLLVPFLIAGFGNVAAGYILDNVQHWPAFKNIPQLLILVPALIGLKGNIEMTMAARLSTHSNLGQLDSVKEFKSIIIGNLALVQCQASVVGLIAPFFAIALSFITKAGNGITLDEVIIITASSVITANIANLLLGILMCVVITLSRKFKINPDNIGTPIAASMGDFTTMLLLAYISQSIYETINWLSALILFVLMLLAPIWAAIARRVSYTKSVLYTGWFPILGAMMLQNTGGLIMENSLTQFQRIAAFQPVINGVGGNLVAIQSSRMSTYLHKNKMNGKMSTDAKACTFPFGIFFGKNRHTLMARLLLMISGPSHILFLFALRITKGHFIITFPFLAFYLMAALIQVAVLLDLCNYLVNLIFRRGLDPDCFAIPFLTLSEMDKMKTRGNSLKFDRIKSGRDKTQILNKAFADLLGSALLSLAFFILFHLNDANALEENTFTNITLIISNTTLANL